MVSDPVSHPIESAPGRWRVPLGNVAPVDVGRSWVRENCVDENGAPNAGTFGGRWAGALSATPCRLQFRVPNRRWAAMDLVVSCTNNPFLTVQFYRPGSGFPVDFTPTEPIVADGSPRHVRVPLRQDLLATFADREILEFELTGKVDLYSAYPEPSYYSRHGGGVPSGVRVHEITLVETDLEVDFDPENFGGVWTGPVPKPAYTVTLRNRTGEEKSVALTRVRKINL